MLPIWAHDARSSLYCRFIEVSVYGCQIFMTSRKAPDRFIPALKIHILGPSEERACGLFDSSIPIGHINTETDTVHIITPCVVLQRPV